MTARRSNAVRDRDGSRPWDDPDELRGINLRSWITLELLRERRPMTVAELVPRAEALGFRLAARTSKAISDALRAEVSRGRVRRLGRGRYVAVAHAVPRTTRWRMRRRLEACRRRLATARPAAVDPAVALTRNAAPTPTPCPTPGATLRGRHRHATKNDPILDPPVPTPPRRVNKATRAGSVRPAE